MAQTAMDLSSLTGFVGLGDGETTEEWYAWLAQPEVELLTGHEIESDVWYTANARWLLYGPAVDEAAAPVGYIACVWSMKVLFSARDNEAPTLLTSEEPSPPDTGDESCMRILQVLKKQVADIVAGASAGPQPFIPQLNDCSPEQLAPSLAKLDTAANQLALQIAARQAALIDGPAQQLAKQIAAQRAALINGPAQRLARQMAHSMPKLDLAVDLHQPSGHDEAVGEEVEQVEQSDSPDAPEARAAGTEDTPADDDHAGE
ncbi:hypothetical protein [Streptomyces fradiae]|uniref:hypothetical protein n=1 Tax=Streptomyces fradiae TaxID=1906 RepID=UPI0039884579